MTKVSISKALFRDVLTSLISYIQSLAKIMLSKYIKRAMKEIFPFSVNKELSNLD